jgi:2-phosphosulfolactate phosphatase
MILSVIGRNVVIRTGVKGVAEASKDSDMIIVVDALRASSTIITAIENGASNVFPTLTVREARDLARKTPNSILAGERKGFRIPGFRLGNSPLEYTSQTVQGKNIVLTTSNCTRVLDACKRLSSGKKVVIGALLNAWAIAELSRNLLDRGNGRISIIQAGTRGRRCEDDQICAEVLQTMIEHESEYSLAPSVQNIVNLLLYSIMSKTKHGKHLIRIGYDNDVRYCSQLSISDIIPELSRDRLGPVRIINSLDTSNGTQTLL